MMSMTIANASADSPWPTRNSKPQIVENQCGLSDISQSTVANVRISPCTTSPPPDSLESFEISAGSPVRSCSADHLLRSIAITDQTAQ